VDIGEIHASVREACWNSATLIPFMNMHGAKTRSRLTGSSIVVVRERFNDEDGAEKSHVDVRTTGRRGSTEHHRLAVTMLRRLTVLHLQ